jgi:hypothetical protein
VAFDSNADGVFASDGRAVTFGLFLITTTDSQVCRFHNCFEGLESLVSALTCFKGLRHDRSIVYERLAQLFLESRTNNRSGAQCSYVKSDVKQLPALEDIRRAKIYGTRS